MVVLGGESTDSKDKEEIFIDFESIFVDDGS